MPADYFIDHIAEEIDEAESCQSLQGDLRSIRSIRIVFDMFDRFDRFDIQKMQKFRNATFEGIKSIVPGFFRIGIRFERISGRSA